MAKKRKVGGTYKVGFYSLKKKFTGKDEDIYLQSMYKKNKKFLTQAYKAARKMAKKAKDEKAIDRFKKAYPNIKIWIKAKVKSAIITSTEELTFVEGVKEAIRLNFMAPVTRFKYNIITGLKSFGLYEDFMFYINEELNTERLNYADGNYIYKTEKGKKVMIEVENSPYRMEIRVLGEEKSRVLGER